MHVISLSQGLNVKLAGFTRSRGRVSITIPRPHELYTRLSVVHVEIKVKYTGALNTINRMCNNNVHVSVNVTVQLTEGSVGEL